MALLPVHCMPPDNLLRSITNSRPQKLATHPSDACEWENLLSIFHPDAYIYTTWTGRTHHADFIRMSQDGMDNGAFFMHRTHGSTTDINPAGTHAVTR
ncbi:hypothetical protein MMC13_002594 [Lambiella insularis]|nr:hypothetical protein [Lambiella insularis]